MRKKRVRSRPSHWKVLTEWNFTEDQLTNQWQLFLFTEAHKRSDAESWFPHLQKKKIPYFLASYGRMDMEGSSKDLKRVFGVFVPSQYVTGRLDQEE